MCGEAQAGRFHALAHRNPRIDGVSSWRGPIYTYRWYQDGDMFYWVYLDPQGVVRRAHPGIEHVNAPNDRN